MEERVKVVYKEKKSTGKTISIVILIILLLCSLSYIGYNEYQKLIADNEKEKVVEERQLYYSEVETIMSQIELYNYIFKEAYPIEDINSIDNQLKLKFGIYALKEVENINNYYKIEDMEEIYNDYFVDGFNAIYEDINCDAKDDVLYELNDQTKTYTEKSGHEHDNPTVDIDTYFVKGEIDNNEYIIDTHILYSNYCNGTCNPMGGYYKSYNDVVKGTNPVTYRRSEYKNIKDTLPTTVYTFVKEKNRFKLKNIDTNY